MFRDVFVLLACGVVSYLWLCAIVSPLASPAQSIIRDGGNRAAWAALALAGGGAVLWTAIVVAAIGVGMMLEPGSGLRIWRSDVAWRGVSFGNIVWACQLIASARLPRIGHLDRMHAVAPASASGDAVVSGAVHGVAA
jgi:hypothetical protein